MRQFYVERLGGRSGPLYENPRTGFRSYFVEFDGGGRVELMSQLAPLGSVAEAASGYAHVAFSVEDEAAVDALVERFADRGVAVVSKPRMTGDGCYEAAMTDPEGNRIEIVASQCRRKSR